MPNSLNDYRLLTQEDLQDCRHPRGTVLTGIYLSGMGLVVSLEITASPDAKEELRDQLKEELLVTMRLLQDRLLRFGVSCPAIALLHLTGVDSPDPAAENAAFRKAYRALAADQDWHRGEFLLFVEDCCAAANNRLEDLLNPKPPGQEIAASAPTLQEIIDRCKNGGEDSLLSEILTAWQDQISPGDLDQQMREGEIDPGVHAIRNRLNQLNNEATASLSELD